MHDDVAAQVDEKISVSGGLQLLGKPVSDPTLGNATQIDGRLRITQPTRRLTGADAPANLDATEARMLQRLRNGLVGRNDPPSPVPQPYQRPDRDVEHALARRTIP
nr:hypothetical protein [Bifidobacterium ramosum]